MNIFEQIAHRAAIRRGMITAYLDLGMDAWEAFRLAHLWDGMVEEVEES